MTGDGVWIKYSAFGDGAFGLRKECIQSYYKSYGAGAPIMADQERCNHAMKAARLTIEKNYGMTSNIFKICVVPDECKLAKRNPHAIEQLRVCHLLVNCYVCFKGDQAGSDNTFGLTPPKLEEYLAL